MQTTLSIYGESLPEFMKKVDIAECLAVINTDDWVAFSEDWFVQNTHNNDFRYKNKMPTMWMTLMCGMSHTKWFMA